MKLFRRKGGFTLIELMVVIAVISLVTAITIVALISAKQQSSDAHNISNLQKVHVDLEIYYNEHNAYPSSLSVTGQDFCCISADECVFEDTVYTACAADVHGNISQAPDKDQWASNPNSSFLAAADAGLTKSNDGKTIINNKVYSGVYYVCDGLIELASGITQCLDGHASLYTATSKGFHVEKVLPADAADITPGADVNVTTSTDDGTGSTVGSAPSQTFYYNIGKQNCFANQYNAAADTNGNGTIDGDEVGICAQGFNCNGAVDSNDASCEAFLNPDAGSPAADQKGGCTIQAVNGVNTTNFDATATFNNGSCMMANGCPIAAFQAGTCPNANCNDANADNNGQAGACVYEKCNTASTDTNIYTVSNYHADTSDNPDDYNADCSFTCVATGSNVANNGSTSTTGNPCLYYTCNTNGLGDGYTTSPEYHNASYESSNPSASSSCTNFCASDSGALNAGQAGACSWDGCTTSGAANIDDPSNVTSDHSQAGQLCSFYTCNISNPDADTTTTNYHNSSYESSDQNAASTCIFRCDASSSDVSNSGSTGSSDPICQYYTCNDGGSFKYHTDTSGNISDKGTNSGCSYYTCTAVSTNTSLYTVSNYHQNTSNFSNPISDCSYTCADSGAANPGGTGTTGNPCMYYTCNTNGLGDGYTTSPEYHNASYESSDPNAASSCSNFCSYSSGATNAGSIGTCSWYKCDTSGAYDNHTDTSGSHSDYNASCHWYKCDTTSTNTSLYTVSNYHSENTTNSAEYNTACSYTCADSSAANPGGTGSTGNPCQYYTCNTNGTGDGYTTSPEYHNASYESSDPNAASTCTNTCASGSGAINAGSSGTCSWYKCDTVGAYDYHTDTVSTHNDWNSLCHWYTCDTTSTNTSIYTVSNYHTNSSTTANPTSDCSYTCVDTASNVANYNGTGTTGNPCQYYTCNTNGLGDGYTTSPEYHNASYESSDPNAASSCTNFCDSGSGAINAGSSGTCSWYKCDTIGAYDYHTDTVNTHNDWNSLCHWYTCDTTSTNTSLYTVSNYHTNTSTTANPTSDCSYTCVDSASNLANPGGTGTTGNPCQYYTCNTNGTGDGYTTSPEYHNSSYESSDPNAVSSCTNTCASGSGAINAGSSGACSWYKCDTTGAYDYHTDTVSTHNDWNSLCHWYTCDSTSSNTSVYTVSNYHSGNSTNSGDYNTSCSYTCVDTASNVANYNGTGSTGNPCMYYTCNTNGLGDGYTTSPEYHNASYESSDPNASSSCTNVCASGSGAINAGSTGTCSWYVCDSVGAYDYQTTTTNSHDGHNSLCHWYTCDTTSTNTSLYTVSNYHTNSSTTANPPSDCSYTCVDSASNLANPGGTGSTGNPCQYYTCNTNGLGDGYTISLEYHNASYESSDPNASSSCTNTCSSGSGASNAGSSGTCSWYVCDTSGAYDYRTDTTDVHDNHNSLCHWYTCDTTSTNTSIYTISNYHTTTSTTANPPSDCSYTCVDTASNVANYNGTGSTGNPCMYYTCNTDGLGDGYTTSPEYHNASYESSNPSAGSSCTNFCSSGSGASNAGQSGSCSWYTCDTSGAYDYHTSTSGSHSDYNSSCHWYTCDSTSSNTSVYTVSNYHSGNSTNSGDYNTSCSYTCVDTASNVANYNGTGSTGNPCMYYTCNTNGLGDGYTTSPEYHNASYESSDPNAASSCSYFCDWSSGASNAGSSGQCYWYSCNDFNAYTYHTDTTYDHNATSSGCWYWDCDSFGYGSYHTTNSQNSWQYNSSCF